MSPAEPAGAAEIWRLLSAAAHSIAACALPGRQSLNLGDGLSAQSLRELTGLSGGILETYRAQDEDSSLVHVHCYFRAVVAGVALFALTSRPATAADAHLPFRGGRS